MRQRLLFVLASLVLAASAQAQSWPSKAVRVIVPFPPGGAVDVVARVVLEPVATAIGQPIVVENRTGAGGTIGAAAVAKAEPDGYTLLVHSSSHTVAPALFASLPYDAERDLVPVIAMASQPTALMVASAKGHKSLQDFVETAKKNKLSYGSGGVGNATHLVAERFQLAAGFKAEHVPYKGSPEAIREVVAGRIDFSFSTLAPALAFVRDGSLKILAVTDRNRASALPDVPTTLEAGYKDSDYTFWIGMLAPRGVPQPVVERLYRESAKALELSEVAARLTKVGADRMRMTTAEFRQMISSEIGANRALVKAAGIPLN